MSASVLLALSLGLSTIVPSVDIPKPLGEVAGTTQQSVPGSSTDVGGVSVSTESLEAAKQALIVAENGVKDANARWDEAVKKAEEARVAEQAALDQLAQTQQNVGSSVRSLWMTGTNDLNVFPHSDPDFGFAEAVSSRIAAAAAEASVVAEQAKVYHTQMITEQQNAEQARVDALNAAATAAASYKTLSEAAWQEAQRQALLGSANPAAGTPVGVASGLCPVVVAAGTLRDGSETIGAEELCKRSSAGAASKAAADAIAYGFRVLGSDYACLADPAGTRELPGHYDCSSLVTRAYKEGAGVDFSIGGLSQTTFSMLSDNTNFERVSEQDAMPGDLIIYQHPGMSGPASQHVVLLLSDGYMLHTNSCGDVAHVAKFTGFTDGSNGTSTFLAALRVKTSA